ncbi:hypothetical protein HYH02_005868 [Chlamydomonas schloesseri]|uniref:Protein kinase domain-containing protein n=1 Tax=Chlamydomonas schloesseri TaxID=2026947 RepID=A0A836B6P3_9CHLO|nr:hypothetical protein HYH02_005868 [Chlamydomonas schloesseri]|eukprot:KAG2449120.1 hypothetical protein HYH02_005868 [Chlamydomonas schloesseri]
MDRVAWDEYADRVSKMALPAPRTAATGSLVSAYKATFGGSGGKPQAAGGDADGGTGQLPHGILGAVPMTPDEALARLTGKATSSGSESSRQRTNSGSTAPQGASPLQPQQPLGNEGRTFKLPQSRAPIPGPLTKSGGGKERSLRGLVGDKNALAAPGLTSAGASGQPAAGQAAGQQPMSPAGAKAVAPSAVLGGPSATSALATGVQLSGAVVPGVGGDSMVGGGIAPPPSLQAGAVAQGVIAPGPDVRMDINLEELTFGQEIGRGGFGKVYSGTYQGTPVAIKMLLGNATSALSELAALRLEVSILSRANHPNVVKIYGGNLSPPKPFIVAELLMCSLHDYIYHPQADTRTLLVVRLARGIAAALSYLHPSVVHRDLKPGNVLLSQEGVPKIADFGLARWKLKTLLSTQTLEAGSVPYLAPECFDPDVWRLSTSVDIYSLAIIMSEMLMRRPPWHGMSSMQVAWEVHVQGRRPALPPASPLVPVELLQLIEACWHQDPKERPSATQVYVVLSELHDRLEELEAGGAPAGR